MNIFLDIDNTICNVDESHGSEKYIKATPIISHIHRANKLYDDGNRITYWTARGKASGVDYSELTRRQLQDWGCKYHELRLDKPSYDLYVDDKSQNTLAYFGSTDSSCDCTDCKITIGSKVPKGWGHELVIANNEKYCGKVLHFNRGARFSMHYHIRKTETWYVASGQFEFRWIDTSTANMHSRILNIGDIVTNEIGQPHQLICLNEGDIFEVSTQHFDSDSYRVIKGDSQGADSSLSSNKKYKYLVVLIHMGLGDHIIMAPAISELSKDAGKLFIPCKTIYFETLKCIYGNIKNLELIPISLQDERNIGPEIERVLGELHKKLEGGPITLATSGMYNPNPNPTYPFPSGFYKDLGMDFLSCSKKFTWNSSATANSTFTTLLQILKQFNIQHIFVHDTSSTKKSEHIENDASRAASSREASSREASSRSAATHDILLNPDRNMYESHHPYYYLAQLAVRTEKTNILDYIVLMESARSLYLIDSCYFCISAFIEHLPGTKHLYKRANVNYEWVRDDKWYVNILN